ncbi:MAG: hypothetical protein H0X02_05550 [Nitrosomonas sp.]|nr:hypothetical protein [Nitrosomonas sp.]
MYTSRMILLKWIASVLIGFMTLGCTTEINLKTDPAGTKENNQTTQVESSTKGESMKFSRKPPESWFWSHDIDPHHIDDVLLPGMHLTRLSVYGGGKNRRFAAVSFRESGIESIYFQNVAAAELDSKIAEVGARPVSITADEVNGQLRFSLTLQKGSVPKTSVHINLDETGLSQLVNDQRRIADFTTYVIGGIRKYAAIVEERPGPSWIFARVTAKELDANLRKHDATPVRLRGFSENGVRYFTAIAEHLDVGNWAWYDDIDGDTVAGKLDSNNAYPVDLEAYRDERGVRYTVVMYRDRDSH